MDFIGLIKKFKVNRELSADEKDNHLFQTQRKQGEPDAHKSVIKMNSTCLQICDKFFFDRGIPTAYGIFLFIALHYPIRFNRKTRMVHVFRIDGTIMSEPWDKLYFTLGKTKDNSWEVRGHTKSINGY